MIRSRSPSPTPPMTRSPTLPATAARLPSAAAATAQCRVDTPLGPVTLAATGAGLCGLWFDGQSHHPGPLPVPVSPGQRWLAAAREMLAAYFAGEPTAFDSAGGLVLDLHGTAFQQQVWQALQQVPAGRTATYGDIAVATGRPAAVRAAAAAIGRNPLSIAVPCHRVIGRDGSLTGYAGGLDRKRALLRLEAASTGEGLFRAAA